MHFASPISRRHFLAASALAAFVPTAARSAETAPARPFPIITFTKPFQDIGFDETADVIAEVGFDGIECPVRAKGQIEPERVDDDLPQLHAALKKRGRELSLLTTEILKVDALAEKVLRAANRLGVRRYRLGYWHYDLAQPIPPQLANLKAQLRDLAALNRELGLHGGIQNHSGSDYIGGPVWDLYELVRDIDPAHLGACFDIGHATLEGGTSWPINAKLMEPFLACVYVKDFAWIKADKGWQAKWGPLGEGMVRREFIDWLKRSTYRGPISLHCEYLTGAGPEQVAQMKRDLEVLKGWLA